MSGKRVYSIMMKYEFSHREAQYAQKLWEQDKLLELINWLYKQVKSRFDNSGEREDEFFAIRADMGLY